MVEELGPSHPLSLQSPIRTTLTIKRSRLLVVTRLVPIRRRYGRLRLGDGYGTCSRREAVVEEDHVHQLREAS